MRDSSRWMRHLLAAVGVLLALGLLAVAPDVWRMDLGSLGTRASWQLPDRVLEALEVRAGDQVADVGAGDGYFAFRLAAAVGPTGRVHAVEVDDELVAELGRKVREGRHDNVVMVKGDYDDPHLPDGQIDIALFCNSYHHIEDRVTYFDRLRGDLAEGGRVAILDLRASLLVRILAPPGHWTAVETMQDEMKRASYALAEQFDFLPAQTFVVFKPA